MRFSRVLIRHGRLSRAVLPALILFILYILAFLTSELFVAIHQHFEAPTHKGESLEVISLIIFTEFIIIPIDWVIIFATASAFRIFSFTTSGAI